MDDFFLACSLSCLSRKPGEGFWFGECHIRENGPFLETRVAEAMTAKYDLREICKDCSVIADEFFK